jgi:catechol 2,3-dioxygenase-like lactoylglutathione lyase family enzyme
MAGTSVTPVARITPILHCDDAMRTAEWYGRLGFVVAAVHGSEAGAPLFVTLHAGDLWIFLSEHEGDARPDTLVYLHVDDVDDVARAFGTEAQNAPWGMREVHLTDPDGNRVRVGAGLGGR